MMTGRMKGDQIKMKPLIDENNLENISTLIDNTCVYIDEMIMGKKPINSSSEAEMINALAMLVEAKSSYVESLKES